MKLIEDYTPTSAVVYEATLVDDGPLKALGGKYRPNLKVGPGYIFDRATVDLNAVRALTSLDAVPKSSKPPKSSSKLSSKLPSKLPPIGAPKSPLTRPIQVKPPVEDLISTFGRQSMIARPAGTTIPHNLNSWNRQPSPRREGETIIPELNVPVHQQTGVAPRPTSPRLVQAPPVAELSNAPLHLHTIVTPRLSQAPPIAELSNIPLHLHTIATPRLSQAPPVAESSHTQQGGGTRYSKDRVVS